MSIIWNSENIKQLSDESYFNQIALQFFKFQYENTEIYRNFVNLLNVDIDNIIHYTQIPFLPISFFKSHRIQIGSRSNADYSIFESSGTTGLNTSRHYITDISIYHKSLRYTFESFFGNPNDYVFLCLLPSYIERNNSSLVYMCQELISDSGNIWSGFYLNEYDALIQVIKQVPADKKIFLIGVTFGLLDFAEKYECDLSHAIIMETGGMKGRREEWTREEVHQYLSVRFNNNNIQSEYGMTELLSQAYSLNKGVFETPPFMKILCRDINDPMSVKKSGNGLLNVIDLANEYSCSFIATDDITQLYPDGTFEVLGRKDNSILRGCSMLAL